MSAKRLTMRKTREILRLRIRLQPDLRSNRSKLLYIKEDGVEFGRFYQIALSFNQLIGFLRDRQGVPLRR